MKRFKNAALLVLLVVLALTAYSKIQSPDTAIAARLNLGFTGEPTEYSYLKGHGLSLNTYAMWESWDMQRPPTALLNEAGALGAIPFINWQPLDSKEPNGPRFSLPTILAGDQDHYIETWARDIAAYGGTVYLRMGHEMNGDWYPWHNYGTKTYIAFWRHVVSIFRALGATNAKFIWSPDGLIGHNQRTWERSVVKWWPGRHYVDYVGMSTVVFKTSSKYGLAYFFQRVGFLHEHFRKPVVLPEMKIVRGERLTWLKALRPELHARPWIRVLVWSDTPSTAQAAGQFGTGDMNWTLTTDSRARQLLARAAD